MDYECRHFKSACRPVPDEVQYAEMKFSSNPTSKLFKSDGSGSGVLDLDDETEELMRTLDHPALCDHGAAPAQHHAPFRETDEFEEAELEELMRGIDHPALQ